MCINEYDRYIMQAALNFTHSPTNGSARRCKQIGVEVANIRNTDERMYISSTFRRASLLLFVLIPSIYYYFGPRSVCCPYVLSDCDYLCARLCVYMPRLRCFRKSTGGRLHSH